MNLRAASAAYLTQVQEGLLCRLVEITSDGQGETKLGDAWTIIAISAALIVATPCAKRLI